MSTAIIEKSSQITKTVSSLDTFAFAPDERPESARIPITRRMAHALADMGLIEGKWELIDGEIIAKMPQKRPHSYTLNLLFRWLVSLFGIDFVQAQEPIDPEMLDAEINEPEPDIVVLNMAWDTMITRNPLSSEVILTVEVANTTLMSDLSKKASLYAYAGIVEYWIADTNARTIIVHREPNKGKYQSVVTYTAEQEISCLAKPEKFKKVDELIAPPITETPQNIEQ